ncbi:MAG: DNA alkylation repair protein [Bacteroidetes bacterium]|nr:DNA alkylation repair protein [Bacteroidota bacterium]
MKPSDLFNDIRAYCIANADEAIVQKYSRYFKEGYDAYGLTQQQNEAKVKMLVESQGVDLPLVLSTAPLLLKTGKYEETSFALRLLMSFSKQYTKEIFEELGHWFETGITNWGHTDFTCSEIISVFFKKGIITYTDLATWRNAKSKFQRRAVPVSLIKKLKTTTDYKPFLVFIEPMMMDPEREVHQGLGWFLREAWKKQPGQVEPFLLKYKNTAPRLIFQYATEKMTPDQKQKFRKEK